MSHALESLTARPYPRRLNPAKGVNRPVSQGANPFSDMLAAEALRSVGTIPRARGERRRRYRGAHRDDVRGDACRHRVQCRRLPSAARIVVRGVGPHEGLARRRLSGGQDARSARHGSRAQQSVGLALHGALAAPSATCTARTASAPESTVQRPATRAKCSPGRVIELMRATAMPNGLDRARLRRGDIGALATGAEPQYRVIRNAPKDVGRERSRSALSLGAQLLVSAVAGAPCRSGRSSARHASRRKDGGERAPAAGLALDRELRLVP